MGYKDVTVPEDTPPEDYNYIQRRAELLQRLIEAGHPDRLSRTQCAEQYDVHPSTITRDIQALREEIRSDISTDADFVSHVLFQKALRDTVEREAWSEAINILESWNKWLSDRGFQE